MNWRRNKPRWRWSAHTATAAVYEIMIGGVAAGVAAQRTLLGADRAAAAHRCAVPARDRRGRRRLARVGPCRCRRGVPRRSFRRPASRHHRAERQIRRSPRARGHRRRPRWSRSIRCERSSARAWTPTSSLSAVADFTASSRSARSRSASLTRRPARCSSSAPESTRLANDDRDDTLKPIPCGSCTELRSISLRLRSAGLGCPSRCGLPSRRSSRRRAASDLRRLSSVAVRRRRRGRRTST